MENKKRDDIINHIVDRTLDELGVGGVILIVTASMFGAGVCGMAVTALLLSNNKGE